MSERVVVIGGGHNGLVAACYLARAGRQVTVLEARDRLGGLAAREAITTGGGDRPAGEAGAESSGFAVPGVLHDTRGFRGWIADDLGLAGHGLRRRAEPTPVVCPRGEGEPLVLAGDRALGAGPDEAAYRGLLGFIERVGPAIRRLMDRPALDPLGRLWPLAMTGLAVRRLGAATMSELLRVALMCVADWMRDTFEDERLMAAVAAPALEGAFTGPWSAGTAANLLIREATAEAEVTGGAAAVVDALDAAARAAGVELRTSAPAARIELDGEGVCGVVLGSGERLATRLVLSTLDPKHTLLRLVGRERLPVALAEAVANIRTRGTTAVVRLGLSGPLTTADGRAVEALRTGETLDGLERAFDAAKYRRFAHVPALDVRVWSGQGLAPDGGCSVSILAHAAAYDLGGGWTEDARAGLGHAVVEALAAACPDVHEQIEALEVVTPLDLESRYALTGGHLHHGEHAPDQLLFMRPIARDGPSGYGGGFPGLFLGGSGCHPGGGLTGVPGALAARAALG